MGLPEQSRHPNNNARAIIQHYYDNDERNNSSRFSYEVGRQKNMYSQNAVHRPCGWAIPDMERGSSQRESAHAPATTEESQQDHYFANNEKHWSVFSGKDDEIVGGSESAADVISSPVLATCATCRCPNSMSACADKVFCSSCHIHALRPRVHNAIVEHAFESP